MQESLLLTSKYLIEEHFDMVRGERLWRDYDLVKVALHQFCYDVSNMQVKELYQTKYIMLYTSAMTALLGLRGIEHKEIFLFLQQNNQKNN